MTATRPDEFTLPAADCIQFDDTCSGRVELRMSLSGTGVPYPRCDGHWEARLDLEEGIQARYPVHAPADFDPLYAGESWDED